jgi:hypothetical protein
MSENATTNLAFGRWVRATWAGWLLGIPCIILLALLADVVGIGGLQVMVGLGMGASVGWMQGRVLRQRLNQPVRVWFWSCVIGLSAPFLAFVLAKAVGLGGVYSLYLAVALGGLLVGVWQATLLRPYFDNANHWILGSLLGWTLATGTVAIADKLSRLPQVRGAIGALIFLALIALGGLIMGWVTGFVLVRLKRQEFTDSHAHRVRAQETP